MSIAEFINAPAGSASMKCDLANSTEAARALWSPAPDAMRGEDGKRVHDLVEKQCKDQPLHLEEKCEFGEKMRNLWEADGGRNSFTERFYRAGFVTMTSVFVFLFAAIAIVRSWEPKIRSGPEGKRIAGMLLLALFFATSWVLMRAAYLLEKSSIYPEDPDLTFDALILINFLIFFLHAAASRWPIIARYDTFLRNTIYYAGIAAPFTIRFASGLHSETNTGDFIIEGIFLTLVAGFLFRLAICFPFFLQRLDPDGGKQHRRVPD